MRGGYRQNAGRKQGYSAKSAEEARKLLCERVAQEIGPISDILISQAKKGDIRAIRELFDRAWGKAPQAMDIKMENKDNFTTQSGDYLEELANRMAIELKNEKTLI
jgi:hypothetical protein